MSRNVATSIENNFVNGLVTEATALNFPENAASDTDNCVFWPKANFTRRLGIDFESGYTTHTENRADVVVNSFLWQNAAGNGNYNFVVIQVGSTLSFYRVNASGALSGDRMSDTILLTDFAVSGSPSPALTEAQFAYGQGYLFVTHPTCEPFYVEYNPDTEDFTATEITIYMRDFEGVDDGLAVTTRPGGGGSNAHIYNLYNQGWNNSLNVQFASTVGAYPSNADVWWLYKDASEVFTPSLANQIYRGNSPAPKGSFILEAFYQDRSGTSGVSGIPVVSSGYYRPSTVAFFASRVFYAGTQAQGFSNKIYYSQVIETPRQFGLCHQENDPASEVQFDLLATDGGVVNILDCGTVIKLVSLQSSLVIFASNGVWSISGSTGTGFTAQDFTVRRLSSTPCLSASSFVDMGGAPAWWNSDGIYTVAPTNQLGDVGVVSISEKKIKSFFNEEIPSDSKPYAKGFFNSLTKVVQWAYRSTEATTLTERYTFDRILNFNTVTGAFYPWSIDSSPVGINGLVAIQGTGSTFEQETVVDADGNVVTDLGSAAVTVDELTTSSLASFFKYIVSYPSGGSYALTFAEESDERYLDWYTYDSTGVNYDSYVRSGYKVRGDAQKKFNSNYIYLFAGNDNPTQLYLQGIWDYATDGDLGDYTSRQKLNFNTGHKKYDKKRIKLRGSGLAVQFLVTSVDGQPFDVIGWSVFETANSGI